MYFDYIHPSFFSYIHSPYPLFYPLNFEISFLFLSLSPLLLKPDLCFQLVLGVGSALAGDLPASGHDKKKLTFLSQHL